MKVAVLGAGNWGKNLVRTLSQLGSLGAVVEPSAPLRETLKAEYDVPFYESLSGLKGLDISAVAIATPASTHSAVAIEALEMGLDVFVEKPMALSTEECAAILRVAEARSRIVMVGHLLMYSAAIRWMKTFITEGGLGKVHSLHQERLNFGKIRTIENSLWSLGVHDVAVALYLLEAPVTAVKASGQRILHTDVEDDVYLHIEFQGNAQASLHSSWLWPERRRQLSLVGEHGMLVYDEITGEVTLYKKTVQDGVQLLDRGSEVVFRQTGEPLTVELQHFLDCIEERRTPLSDGRSGLEVVRILETASRLLAPPQRFPINSMEGMHGLLST